MVERVLGIAFVGREAGIRVRVRGVGRLHDGGVLVPYDEVEPLADAIIRLLSDRDLAQRMGRAAAADARRRFGYARFRSDLLTAIGLDPSET